MRPSLAIALLALLTLTITGSGCVDPAVYERAEGIIILDETPDPDAFRKIEELIVTERFDSNRPDQNRVLEKLKLRAAKIGADALANVRFQESKRIRITNTPQYIEVTGLADAYKRRPGN